MTKGPARAAALSLIVLAAASAPAAARPASQGFFTEAGVGATGVLPPSQDHAAPGPAMSLRIGYDLFRWLSVGVHASTSSHEATVPAPQGELRAEWKRLGGAVLVAVTLPKGIKLRVDLPGVKKVLTKAGRYEFSVRG